MNKIFGTSIFILLISFILSGCAPAVLVAGATVGWAIIYDKRSYTTMTQDQNARVVAQKRLDQSPLLIEHSHISISVFNNIGLLTGQAQTEHIRDEASRLVSDIPGIKSLYNK